MLRKDADNGATNDRAVIKNIGGDTLNLGTLTRKQRLPSGICRALAASKFVQRSGADFAFDRLAVVQHRKSEHHPGAVITHHLVPRERHNISRLQHDRRCFVLQNLSRLLTETQSYLGGRLRLVSWGRIKARSVHHSTTDMQRLLRHVRSVPTRDSCTATKLGDGLP